MSHMMPPRLSSRRADTTPTGAGAGIANAQDEAAAERRPLLGAAVDAANDDADSEGGMEYSIFHQITHSVWGFLNQSLQCYVRGAILLYLTVAGIMILDYHLEKPDNKHAWWSHIFDFSTIAYGLLLTYHFVAFGWSFTHCHFADIDDNDRSIEARIGRLLSIPRNYADFRVRLYASLFFTLATVAVFMNTASYYFFMVPFDFSGGPGPSPEPQPEPEPEPQPEPELLVERGFGMFKSLPEEPDRGFDGPNWFRPFCLINLYLVTSAIQLVEIFVLTTLKRPGRIPTHIFFLLSATLMYLGWACFGKVVTGHEAFFWLDKEVMGSREAIAGYCLLFLLLAPFCFGILYVLLWLRELLVPDPVALAPVESDTLSV